MLATRSYQFSFGRIRALGVARLHCGVRLPNTLRQVKVQRVHQGCSSLPCEVREGMSKPKKDPQRNLAFLATPSQPERSWPLASRREGTFRVIVRKCLTWILQDEIKNHCASPAPRHNSGLKIDNHGKIVAPCRPVKIILTCTARSQKVAAREGQNGDPCYFHDAECRT